MNGCSDPAQLLFSKGIDTSHPGFYDSPEFLSEERRDPELLEVYASFVQAKDYSSAYLARATVDIPLIADLIRTELVHEGRLGGCIDAAMVISRVLEQRGYWNYLAAGSVTLSFPESPAIDDLYFWSLDTTNRPFAAAHAWVVAPPFKIIDVAISLQQYDDTLADILPPMILAEQTTLAIPLVKDVCSPDIVRLSRLEAAAPLAGVAHFLRPSLPAFLQKFPACLISERDFRIKYVPISISAPDLPFEQMITPLNGRSPSQLYREVIAPRLDAPSV